jgi:hypothetical protein
MRIISVHRIAQTTDNAQARVEYAFLNGLAQQYTLLLELRSKIHSSATPAQDHLAGVPSLQCTVCLGNQAMVESTIITERFGERQIQPQPCRQCWVFLL